MTPKKASKFYTEVAEELNISSTLVEETIEFYYKYIRQMLSNLSDPRINVDGLGHFVIRPKAVRHAIPRYTRTLENYDTSTFASYFNKTKIETKLELLIKLEKKIIKEELRKDNFKIIKDEYYIKNPMEEPETDN